MNNSFDFIDTITGDKHARASWPGSTVDILILAPVSQENIQLHDKIKCYERLDQDEIMFVPTSLIARDLLSMWQIILFSFCNKLLVLLFLDVNMIANTHVN